MLPATIKAEWDAPSFLQYRQAFPPEHSETQEAFEAHVVDLVTRDVKASYLKSLQGYLWEEGYKSGRIKAPLFPDVPSMMARWHGKGIKLMIYSSGSVPAQKLLFKHTDAEPSDLTFMISDWFDTVNAGPKTESSSFEKIASSHPDVLPGQFVFLSDNVREVDAAIAAGMQSKVVVRPGNAELTQDERERLGVIETFDDLEEDFNVKKLETLGKRDRSETEAAEGDENQKAPETAAATGPADGDDSHKAKKLKPEEPVQAGDTKASEETAAETEEKALPSAPSAATGTTISDLLNEIEESNVH